MNICTKIKHNEYILIADKYGQDPAVMPWHNIRKLSFEGGIWTTDGRCITVAERVIKEYLESLGINVPKPEPGIEESAKKAKRVREPK